MKKILLSSLLISAVMMAACEKEGPAEKAGESIDNAVEKAGESIDTAVDKAGETIESAGDKIREETNN